MDLVNPDATLVARKIGPPKSVSGGPGGIGSQDFRWAAYSKPNLRLIYT
jgi:hypothetical protein